MSGEVDITASLGKLEQLLSEGSDRERCFDVLAVLWRWQRDPDLTEESRSRARALVQRYGKQYVGQR